VTTTGRRLRVLRASSALAGRQAPWIAATEPWLGLGYDEGSLRRFLRRAARQAEVFVAVSPASAGSARAVPARQRRVGPLVLGIAVVQPRVLLGDFLSLLAVHPEARRGGVGRSLMSFIEARVLGRRRWLFVSADARNRLALGFYRVLGFERVGRLPDLIAPGRTEILLRKGRPAPR
jgi:ribosomal protein S18 acetylase RimI-like enzyme